MTLVTVRECNFCDTRGTVDSMFPITGEADMCVSCLHVLRQAEKYGLAILNLPESTERPPRR